MEVAEEEGVNMGTNVEGDYRNTAETIVHSFLGFMAKANTGGMENGFFWVGCCFFKEGRIIEIPPCR